MKDKTVGLEKIRVHSPALRNTQRGFFYAYTKKDVDNENRITQYK